MSARIVAGLVVAALFALLNAWGLWYAVVHRETMHGGIHVALLLPAAWATWALAQRLTGQRAAAR